MTGNEIERIYLKEILPKIRKKDLRSVRTWCKKSGVEIVRDSSGEFVAKSDFIRAYNRPFTNLNNKKTIKPIKINRENYKPKSAEGKKCINFLMDI